MKIFGSKLFKGSFVLLVAFNVYNAINFFFQLAMARMLSIEDFGALATLFAIIYILTLFTESIQLIIVKYSANEKDEGKIKNLLNRGHKKAFRFACIFFAIYLVLSIILSQILEIEYTLLALNGLAIFGAFLLPITRGLMQGLKAFKSLGENMILEGSVKLIMALILVTIGWKTYGAISGVIGGYLVAWFFSFIPLWHVVKKEEKEAKVEGLYMYSMPTFFVVMSVLVFYSIDVIIAKIVFSPELAGMYAIASVISKTIFLGTHPISRAMFPLTAEITKDKKQKDIFYKAIGLLVLVILFALIIFYFLSDFIISIFSGKDIIEASSILILLGIAMGFLSISNIILSYKMSLGKIKGYKYLIFFVLLQCALLSIFSANLFVFSIAQITASAIFLWASLYLVQNK